VQGLKNGLEKGIPQGQAMILKRQLQRRFGELPETIEQRLTSATTSELEHWADRILDAASLADIFDA
jgi:hypothetical protein